MKVQKVKQLRDISKTKCQCCEALFLFDFTDKLKIKYLSHIPHLKSQNFKALNTLT